MSRKNGSEPLVVRTEELAVVIQRWLNEWRADRPPDKNWQFRGRRITHSEWGEDSWLGEYWTEPRAEGMPLMGALDALVILSGVPERAITRITRLETKTTALSLADDLLQAIERPDAIHNGEVRVIPNPRWSMERWKEWQQEQGAC